jgi:hypothetical protein
MLVQDKMHRNNVVAKLIIILKEFIFCYCQQLDLAQLPEQNL